MAASAEAGRHVADYLQAMIDGDEWAAQMAREMGDDGDMLDALVTFLAYAFRPVDGEYVGHVIDALVSYSGFQGGHYDGPGHSPPTAT